MRCGTTRVKPLSVVLLLIAFISVVVGAAFLPSNMNDPLPAVGRLGLASKETEKEPAQKHGTLRIFGPDQKGIVAAFSQTLYGHGCGIIRSEQATDTVTNMFFQRLHFDYTTMHTDQITLETGIREVCERFNMQNQLDWGKTRKRIAIMVSKYDHCLWELLLRHKAGELDCDVAVIISNHADLKPVADTFGIP